MARGTAFIGWTVGAGGLILLYSAFKNENPVDIVKNTLTDEDDTPGQIFLKQIQSVVAGTGRNSASGAIGVTTDSGASYSAAPDPSRAGTDVHKSGIVASPRAQKIQARQMSPTLVPIPFQPARMMDYEAVKALVGAAVEYGSPIWSTGTLRSTEVQAAGHASNPGRFAAPGTSAHEVGLAIDVDADKINVTDKRFTDIMHKHGFFNVGRSGPMHFSYGVPA